MDNYSTLGNSKTTMKTFFALYIQGICLFDVWRLHQPTVHMALPRIDLALRKTIMLPHVGAILLQCTYKSLFLSKVENKIFLL